MFVDVGDQDAMQLTMVTVDGAEHPVDATPTSLFTTLRDFDPAQHRHLVLRRGPVVASAWPRTHAADALGTACLRVELEGETRWLGRMSSAAPIRIERVSVPAVVEVPAVWVSTVLGQLVQSPQWPTHFPWYGGDPLRPLNEWNGEAYSFAAFESTTDPVALLDALGESLGDHLSANPTHAAAGEMIAELRRVGHDLWSWDGDGEWEQWGADYMRAAEGAGLRLSFAPPWVGELGFGEWAASDDADEDDADE